VGLSGEIRAVSRIESRISEAEKLGFEKIILSKYSIKGIDKNNFKIDIVPVSKISDLPELLV
jgi:DNA repair protein RadA/Sms